MSSYLPWESPDPKTEIGLKSDVVYGQNFGFTTGIYHTVTLGSRIQVAVNPIFALSEYGNPASSAISDLFGASGMGGNLQMILGTDTRINWGTQYKIILGGEEVKFEFNKKELQCVVPRKICAVIAAVSTLYSLLYCIDDENWRADWTLIFQITLDILLGVLVANRYLHQDFKDEKAHTLEHLWTTLTGKLSGDKLGEAINESVVKGIAAGTGAIGIFIAPVVAEAANEGHFN